MIPEIDSSFLSSVLANIQEEICLYDESLRYIYCNSFHVENEKRNISGFTDLEIVHKYGGDVFHVQEKMSFMRESLRTMNQTEIEEIRHTDSGNRYFLLRFYPFKTEDGTGRIISIAFDITERKRSEEHVAYLAYHDPLTGLSNRTFLNEYLRNTLVQARRHERSVAILFLDLDRFKFINDNLGHEVGDQLLKNVAIRLKECVRQDDTVARLGGDEFTIVLADLAREEDAAIVAEKLLDALSRPFMLAGRELLISGSIGISIFPRDHEDLSSLIQNADLAMYLAKEKGKNNFQFFTNDLNESSRIRLELENRLRRALERSELSLHYQPILDIATNTIRGFEAFIRWNHPELGTIAPEIFIPVAEETGIIMKIGEWALFTACRQNKIWMEKGFHDLFMSVNISGRQFTYKNLVELLTNISKETGVNPSQLQLELSENILLDDPEKSVAIMDQIRKEHFRISIDNFGTGYSSLSYLTRFPVHSIKIDRSFIKDVTTNHNHTSIVMAIIAMCSSLRYHVIAEGVENANQLEFLSSIQCHFIQGYYCSKPLPADHAEALLYKYRLQQPS